MEEIYCFAGNPLDRVSQRRQDAGWVASLLEDPATRVLPLHGLKPPVCHSSAASLDWQSVAPWRPLIDSGNTLILLGIREGRAFFALDAGSTEAASDNGSVLMDARTAAPMIDGGEEGWLSAELHRLVGETALLPPQADALKAQMHFERAPLRASSDRDFGNCAATSLARLCRDQAR